MRDWREEYVICEHVASDERAATRHIGGRACCEACFQKGFLAATLNTEERDGLCVGKIDTILG